MDTFTHAVFGLTIGWAVAGAPPKPDSARPLAVVKAQTTRAIPWVALVAAEAPDVDVILRPIPGLEWVQHRGITHSFVAAPFIALAVALGAQLVFRKTRLSVLYLVSLGALLFGHLLGDVITYRGIRPLLPLSEWRLNYPIIPFIDLWVTLPLAAAALCGFLRPEWRRYAGVGVLTWVGLYLSFRAWIFFT